MKRRNFIKSLSFLPFIPIAAKAVEEEPELYVFGENTKVVVHNRNAKGLAIDQINGTWDEWLDEAYLDRKPIKMV